MDIQFFYANLVTILINNSILVTYILIINMNIILGIENVVFKNAIVKTIIIYKNVISEIIELRMI
jgi:hypothetical protein